MPEVTVERRPAPRYPMVLAAELVEIPRGVKFRARSADFSRTGCYIDTLNPIPQGTEVQLRITHHAEVFMASARTVYVSPGIPPNTSEWKLPICKLGRGAILFPLQV